MGMAARRPYLIKGSHCAGSQTPQLFLALATVMAHELEIAVARQRSRTQNLEEILSAADPTGSHECDIHKELLAACQFSELGDQFRRC